MTRSMLLCFIAALLVITTIAYITVKTNRTETVIPAKQQQRPAVEPKEASPAANGNTYAVLSEQPQNESPLQESEKAVEAPSPAEEEQKAVMENKSTPAPDTAVATPETKNNGSAEKTVSAPPIGIKSNPAGSITSAAMSKTTPPPISKPAAAFATARGSLASRGNTNRSDEILLMPWFDQAEKIFGIGFIATVIDVDTGKTFLVERTYGYNHADVETLTEDDTQVLLDIIGGKWGWDRRAVIVEVNGYRLAASMAPMPHAGLDDAPEDQWVENRSEGYGTGYNLDKIKGNNMEGHIDIHFYQSKTHGTNSVNQKHQEMVLKAYESEL